ADETEALGHHVEGDCIYFDWDYGDVTVTVLCSHYCGTVLYYGDADEVKSEYSNPTCTTNGFTTYTATYYNDISDQTYYNTFVITDAGSATGHTWDEGTVNINATCDTPGSITYTCTVCRETYVEEIPATGHSYEAVVTAPTCTEGGYTTYTCTECGDSYTADETEATGHSYTESYEWSPDFSSCTVTLTCDTCSELVEYVSTTDDEVTITEVDGLFTVTLIHDGMTYSTSVQTYTVTWVDGDGNEIQVDSRLLEGTTVSYSGSTPTKASDNTSSYTFAGWDNAVEPVSGNTTYTATFTASAHNYVATFSWADNLKSASVTLTCSDCDHTVTIDSSDVTIKAVNNLGLVTRTATAEFNGVTYTDSVTTGTSLLVISADYTAVNLAIARANGLDASNYSNFDTVTAAINSVQWGLNVLNQATVNAYAEAINTAISNLSLATEMPIAPYEETVEIQEPVEDTNTESEPDDEPENLEVDDPNPIQTRPPA
ncbi:MAG: hypothetical protein LUG49_09500, partial [Oscillospiraceae bacterium]|nr:hypothetical protein [Oscillospiraceae bacterium]